MALTESDLVARLRTAIAALRDVSAERDALLEAAGRATEPVAIIGVACRFPGKASSPEQLAALLRAGGDAVTEVPAARWTARGGDGTAAATRRGAFLDEVDRFDHGFFGISPREASHMDPQQRLLLEVTWEALERAGRPAAELAGTRAGVFLGVMTTDYLQLSVEAPERDAYTATGNGHAFPAGRIAYTFGLQGPALVVDTACSSSLVATHLGCQSLHSGESDLAIVGGVNLMLSPVTSELSASFNGLAPDGRCKTFDARANGYVRGEGCGVAVLKRLSDAQRDGDPILATIRGSAVNQDGRSTGITTPNVLAQQALLRQALASARVSPAEIDYVETHGTGTPLGDPIEVDALREVLGAPRPDGAPCVLGAVKTNLGHLEAAAGIAGLIKIVMALQDEQIPPNLHFRGLNPRIALDGTPFVIPTAVTPWRRGVRPRIAGVSSFGLSGTNAHVIVEEPPLPAAPPAPPVRASYLVPLSAKTPDALRALADAYAAVLGAADGPTLHDVAYTASCLRSHHEHRIAVRGASAGEIARALTAAVEAGATHTATAERRARRPKLVFVFPGQGSQWPGMGRQLLAQEPAFRDALAVCDDAIRRVAGFSVRDELIADAAHARHGDVGVVQPVLFAIEVAIARLWQAWGIEPDVVVGHSMGEVAAAVVAGALSIDDGARIICRRSDLLRRVRGRGAMAVVELSWSAAEAAVARHAGRLSLAVSNGPRSTVVAGDPAALDELLAELEPAGVFSRRVKVDVASHSPQMDPLRDDLLAAVAEVRPAAGQIEMRSTVTGDPVSGDALGPAYWVDNLRKPVLFSRVVQGLIRDGHEIFLEISPHPILVPAIEENLDDRAASGAAVASLRRHADERAAMLDALGAVYARRFPVPWRRQFRDGGRCVPLPTYPWQRERHWLEQRPQLASAAGEPAPAPDGGRLASALLVPVWRSAPATPAPARARSWLVVSDGPAGDGLVDALRAGGARCVRAIAGAGLRKLTHDSWEFDPASPADHDAILREAFAASGAPRSVVHLPGPGAASGAATDEDLARGLAAAGETALLLAQAMARAGAAGAELWLISHGAVAFGDDRAVAIAQAPLWGLGRTIQLEHPELSCTLLDLGPGVGAAPLCAELLAGEPVERQIALRGDGRHVARLTRPERSAGTAPPAAIRGDATYLITGGAGALGLSLARWLVGQGARSLVLVGRSEPSPDARAAIAALEAAGARVVFAAGDVARAEDVRAIIARIDAELPALRGVVHAAGVLADRALLAVSIDDMRRTAAAKIWGAWNLHRETLGRPLDLFVLYASAASLLGSAGQASYAAANAFLDALAHHRRTLGLPALAIDWGAFSAAGLAASPGRADRLSAMGFGELTCEQANPLVGALLREPLVQVGVVPMELDRVVEAIPELAGAPYFTELIAAPPASADRAGAAIARAAPHERIPLIEDLVCEQLARVIRVDRQRIVRTASFFDTGLDSLMVLELRNRLQRALGISLSASELIARPSARELAEFLDARLASPASLVPAPAASPESPVPAAAVAPEPPPVPAPAVAPEPLAAALRLAPPSPAPPTALPPTRWLRRPTPRPAARARLFCFPYAGGSASMYASWQELLPDDIELCAIQPPGRHQRIDEPGMPSVEALVAELVPELLPYLDRPFAMFGHCLGAIVMYEVLRALAVHHDLHAVLAFAAAAPPPALYLAPSVTSGTSTEFKEVLAFIGFAQREILDDIDAEHALLPPVRADFDMAARYRHARGAALATPLVTFAAREDPFAPPHLVRDWRAETRAWSSDVTFAGGHYFIVPEREAVVRIVREELMLRLAAAAGRPARLTRLDARGTAAARSPARARDAAKLVCFPGLGGGSPNHARLAGLLDDAIEVHAVDLPGRAAAAADLPLGRVDEMVEALLPALRGIGPRCAFLGLDLGALVMFELARRLRREGEPLPQHLFVAAAMAPQHSSFAPLHHVPRERLLETMRSFGLSVADSPRAERCLRADCAAAASYSFVEDAPLAIPITVFLGDRDRFIPRGSLPGWQQHTAAPLLVIEAPGGHDVLGSGAVELVAEAIHDCFGIPRGAADDEARARDRLVRSTRTR